jgi:hypothetical protein
MSKETWKMPDGSYSSQLTPARTPFEQTLYGNICQINQQSVRYQKSVGGKLKKYCIRILENFRK